MPAQMPVEATEQFGNLVYPYVIDMVRNLKFLSFFIAGGTCINEIYVRRHLSGNKSVFFQLNCATDQNFSQLQCRDEIKRAIITSDGELTPNYKYIADLRLEQRFVRTLFTASDDVTAKANTFLN